MKPVKQKVCRNKGCNNKFTPYKTTDKFCSPGCFYKNQKQQPKKQQIRKISKNKIPLVSTYLKKRKLFLSKHPNCAVYPSKKATEIHHMMKRRGFADQYAIDNKIPLYIDERFFLPVSRSGHEKIEENPEWAYANGFSIKNNTKKPYRIK